MKRLFTAAVLLMAGSLGAQAPAPSPASGRPSPPPPVTFAVEVGYVEVDAIVTDRNDQPVRDLQREDFTVLEDGKPQAIDLFTRIDIPYERPEPAAPPPVPLDVKTNAVPFEGRVYVIVLDELHTTTHGSLLVRAAARRFIERNFGEGDLAAVVHTFGSVANGQGLTSDRQMLLAAVDKFIGTKLPSTTLSKIDEYNRTQQTRQQGDPVNDPEEMKRAYDARSSLDVLKGVSEWLSRLHGRRKAVLFFSEGIDYNIYDQINNREASTVLDAIKDATATAVRANVSFYTIDPRGLGGLSAEMMEIQPVFDDPSLGLDTTGLQSDLQFSQDSLRVLADETSGLRGGEHQRLQLRLRARGQGQQRVLRARLLPARAAQGRALPQARGQGLAARPEGPRAQRLLDAAHQAAQAGRRWPPTTRRPRWPRCWTARCRSPGSRCRCRRERSAVRRPRTRRVSW